MEGCEAGLAKGRWDDQSPFVGDHAIRYHEVLSDVVVLAGMSFTSFGNPSSILSISCWRSGGRLLDVIPGCQCGGCWLHRRPSLIPIVGQRRRLETGA